MSLDDARAKIEAWRTPYNETRPHGSLRAVLKRGRDHFLTTAAAYRDMAQPPPYLQRPATVACFSNAPHDSACVRRVISDPVLAMFESEEVAPER